MSQRAAIARGLANNPTILLLDEPFGALDALTRIQMQKEILRIQEKEGTMMVMVTHDIDEAIYLGDRIVVMSARPGEIKDIIEVDRAAAGKRSGAEFAAYKKKIYDYFLEDSDEKYEVEENVFEYDVPEGKLFVMGDNRNNSTDSRRIGFIDPSDVLGKAVLRLYPFDSFGKVS